MNRRILVVEDEQYVFDLIKAAFRPLDCYITRASTMTAAADIVESQNFDVYMLDLDLTSNDTESVFETIHKKKADAKHRIIIHSRLPEQTVYKHLPRTWFHTVVNKGPYSIRHLLYFYDGVTTKFPMPATILGRSGLQPT